MQVKKFQCTNALKILNDFFLILMVHYKFGYCYHSVNIITLSLDQSDHIKRLPLYYTFWEFGFGHPSIVIKLDYKSQPSSNCTLPVSGLETCNNARFDSILHKTLFFCWFEITVVVSTGFGTKATLSSTGSLPLRIVL